MKIRIDKSDRSFLMVCNCGMREIYTNMNAALTAADKHKTYAHKDYTDGIKQRLRYRRHANKK